LSTDSLIVEAIARELNARIPMDVYCLPVWPYGVSTHTRQFPGTLNLGGRVFEDFFLAVVDRLVRLGAEMIYFSNGHGGNHSFLVNVVKYAGERHPGVFVATEWLHTTGPARWSAIATAGAAVWDTAASWKPVISCICDRSGPYGTGHRRNGLYQHPNY
jgi:creatinine amidohydrolase/Fe(II)-dependent formamide hydrolase-like protein